MVWQQKHAEVGEVIEASLSKVTVKYDDGRERTYDIHLALESKKHKGIVKHRGLREYPEAVV